MFTTTPPPPSPWNHGVRGTVPAKVLGTKDLFFKVFRNKDLASKSFTFSRFLGILAAG